MDRRMNVIPMPIDGQLPPAPRSSAGCAPLRRAGSVRRTSSIDACWPEGRDHAMAFDARARDILTFDAGAAPELLALDHVWARIGTDRSIEAISAEPARHGIERLIGARGGGSLRAALDATLPAERDAGSPLYLLIDDFAGASLVAGWAWWRWDGSGRSAGNAQGALEVHAPRIAQMEGVCTGFRPGSSAFTNLEASLQGDALVAPLANPDDPLGWHELPQFDGPTMRRARRIDVWRDGDEIRIDAMFQDSAGLPEGGRAAVHEYTLQARADATTLRLTGVHAQPRVLPYPECPSAVENLDRLLGAPLHELRAVVLERLPRTLGCTHLNDALRALAEVPMLLQYLDENAETEFALLPYGRNRQSMDLRHVVNPEPGFQRHRPLPTEDRMGKDSDIVAVGAARTALGGFGGTLRDVSVWELGANAIRGALERARLPGDQVQQAIWANCRQAGNGTNPGRTAALKAGLPHTTPVFTINMACPSGLKSVMLASQELALGNARFVVAGGMESMSTMPYLLKNARWTGFKSGDRTLLDSWSDGSVDPICGLTVGQTAEAQAVKYKVSRADQDEFAAQSQQKAARAQAEGLTASEIVPFQLPPSRDNPDGLTFDKDEAIRGRTTVESLAKLKPVFQADGTVTAGNACAMGDGAAALVLTTRGTAKALGLKPLFSVVAFAQAGCDPALMGDGPVHSIPPALAKAGMTLADVDFIEVNEPFAASVVANERVLGWDRAKLNVYGGSIALTHPTGVSGARILVTLDNILRRQDKEIGLASICGGGGVTGAMVIRRES